jgi:hypothetical protein
VCSVRLSYHKLALRATGYTLDEALANPVVEANTHGLYEPDDPRGFEVDDHEDV